MGVDCWCSSSFSAVVFFQRRAKKIKAEQAQLEAKLEAEREQALMQERERQAQLEAKLEAEREAARVENIESKEDAWGKSICDYLIEADGDVDSERVAGIMSRVGEWGQDDCLALLQRRLSTGMSDEMIRASLGDPPTIDMQDISEKVKKYRWVYGKPRVNAVYIWFKDDKVTRIKA